MFLLSVTTNRLTRAAKNSFGDRAVDNLPSGSCYRCVIG
jgi:hypothetical protein